MEATRNFAMFELVEFFCQFPKTMSPFTQNLLQHFGQFLHSCFRFITSLKHFHEFQLCYLAVTMVNYMETAVFMNDNFTTLAGNNDQFRCWWCLDFHYNLDNSMSYINNQDHYYRFGLDIMLDFVKCL